MQKPSQRIKSEKIRQRQELSKSIKREVDRYVDETWSKNWAGWIKELKEVRIIVNKIERILKGTTWWK